MYEHRQEVCLVTGERREKAGLKGQKKSCEMGISQLNCSILYISGSLYIKRGGLFIKTGVVFTSPCHIVTLRGKPY